MSNMEKLMQNLPQGLDAALITSDVNRRYYTGFPSSAGTLIVTRQECWLIIDSRYFEAASNRAKGCQVILQDKLYEQVLGILRQHNVISLGVESDTMSLSTYMGWKDKLEGVEIAFDKRFSEVVNRQRAVKTREEIDAIQASQDITDKTFQYALEILKPGMSEKEIALEMEFYSRRNGSEEAAFSFIVAAGPNSSMPHAVPGENVVKSGDFVVMDFGSTYGGYRSDMTRTVAVGEPSDRQREVYYKVLEAQLKSMEKIAPGVVCGDVDKVARDLINASEFTGLFGHGLGHSLGLEIHEDPRFSPGCDVVLEAGMVLSVEPGIYLPGEFGVRIEDIVCITEDGYHNFTGSPKELIVL